MTTMMNTAADCASEAPAFGYQRGGRPGEATYYRFPSAALRDAWISEGRDCHTASPEEANAHGFISRHSWVPRDQLRRR